MILKAEDWPGSPSCNSPRLAGPEWLFFMFILIAAKFEVIVLISLCVASTEVLHRKANDRFAISQYWSMILLFVVLTLPVIGGPSHEWRQVCPAGVGERVSGASLTHLRHYFITSRLRHHLISSSPSFIIADQRHFSPSIFISF